MTYWKIVILIIFLVSFLHVISCEKSTDNISDTTSTEGYDIATLSFRITWNDYSGRGEAIQKIVSDYNKVNNGGNIISMISGDEDVKAIQNLLDSDSQTIYVLPYRYVKYFSKNGYLMDLTANFKESEELFYPEVWNLGTVNGATYGIPWLGHSMCLLYNKSLLQAAGVNASSVNSLATLLVAIKTVEEKTDAQGIGLVGADSNDVSWMVNQFIYGFGGKLVSDDGEMVAINSDKAKAALEFYKNVLGEHAQATWVNDTGIEVMSYFRKAQVAFEIQGIWGVTDVLKNGAPFDVGIISLGEIGLCAEVGPMMLAVPASMNDDNKTEAIKFIHYLISMDAQEKIMNGEYSPEHDTYYPFRTPIRMDMADSQIFKNYPEYMTFLKGFQNPSIDVPVPAWELIKETIYDKNLHRLMNDEITIDAFLDKIEVEGNKILTEQQQSN